MKTDITKTEKLHCFSDDIYSPFGLTPFVSTYATDEKQYQWNTTSKNCSEIDLRNYFGKI